MAVLFACHTDYLFTKKKERKREEQELVEPKTVSDCRAAFLIQTSNLSVALQLQSIQRQRGIKSGASDWA
jgi:hypothetical protein